MPKWAVRVALICFHVVQYLVTWSAGLAISSVIAALLIGAQVLPRDHFVKTFRVRPMLVSQLGSLVWIFVAFVEMAARQ
jgi:hypothetical protein